MNWMQKKHNEIVHFEIPEEGIVLLPHIFYLGVTLEYTETHSHVPFLEGKSSTGRLALIYMLQQAREMWVFAETGHWKFQ
jgi:deoxycytidine triphosphate deaminase